MKQVTLSEFQSNVPYYIMLIEKGTDLVIKSKNKLQSNQQNSKDNNSRPYGLAKGIFKVPDNFDDALTDEIINLFYK